MFLRRLSLFQQLVCIPHILSCYELGIRGSARPLSFFPSSCLTHTLTFLPGQASVPSPSPPASGNLPTTSQSTHICPKRNKPSIPSIPQTSEGPRCSLGEGVSQGSPDPPAHPSSPFPQLIACLLQILELDRNTELLIPKFEKVLFRDAPS